MWKSAHVLDPSLLACTTTAGLWHQFPTATSAKTNGPSGVALTACVQRLFCPHVASGHSFIISATNMWYCPSAALKAIEPPHVVSLCAAGG